MLMVFNKYVQLQYRYMQCKLKNNTFLKFPHNVKLFITFVLDQFRTLNRNRCFKLCSHFYIIYK